MILTLIILSMLLIILFNESLSKKIVIVSKYDNLIIYLKKNKVKSSTIFNVRNLNKVNKFNQDKIKKYYY